MAIYFFWDNGNYIFKNYIIELTILATTRPKFCISHQLTNVLKYNFFKINVFIIHNIVFTKSTKLKIEIKFGIGGVNQLKLR